MAEVSPTAISTFVNYTQSKVSFEKTLAWNELRVRRTWSSSVNLMGKGAMFATAEPRPHPLMKARPRNPIS